MVDKPSSKEQEYFIAKEVARLKELREQHLHGMKDQERKAMKEAHYLRCAKCGQKMETTTLSAIEVEVCPDCGGVYLDAGELNKILDEAKGGSLLDTLKVVRRLWSEK